jgi:hypothetical protein
MRRARYSPKGLEGLESVLLGDDQTDPAHPWLAVRLVMLR